MRNELIRDFIRLGRRKEPMFADAQIRLLPREYYGYSKRIRCEHTFVFDVATSEGMQVAGEIALRIGDSAEMFYLGHIGYHIDPPFRGHGYAAHACLLAAPVFRALDMRAAVITTDPDNQPSVKTCLRLGCQWESTVPVPLYIKDKLDISDIKHRFIWTLREG